MKYTLDNIYAAIDKAIKRNPDTFYQGSHYIFIGAHNKLYVSVELVIHGTEGSTITDIVLLEGFK